MALPFTETFYWHPDYICAWWCFLWFDVLCHLFVANSELNCNHDCKDGCGTGWHKRWWHNLHCAFYWGAKQSEWCTDEGILLICSRNMSNLLPGCCPQAADDSTLLILFWSLAGGLKFGVTSKQLVEIEGFHIESISLYRRSLVIDLNLACRKHHG